MEGGVAILLLLVLIAIIAVGVFAFTSVGGALSLSRRSDAGEDGDERPVHTRPTTPYHENTTLVGADQLDESAPSDRSEQR